jgi:hypothetical protein
MRRILIAVCLGALALGACSTSSTKTSSTKTSSTKTSLPHVSDGEAVARLVQCDGYHSESTESILTGHNRPISKGKCTAQGEDVSIEVYADAGALQNAEGVARTMVCGIVKGSTFHGVKGDNWFATPDSETVARQLAGTSGGQLHTINC